MIVRTWHGCVPLHHAEGFARHLALTGVEHSKNTPGNLGAFVRRETQGDWEHFFLATYWRDIEAVKAFAGEDYHVAVTYQDDEQFALLSDPYVFQHSVESVSAL
ncbi:antibiotic biosynthesis monooxygenase [Pantoea sp. MQR6]|uniref:antibiotic biosynthesis monooxygenase n=1 Tax=Pantoea sp. MQR6 TaxID=2907307 RepID=UPI001FAAB73F|nr:antibiotic biosynthesis monooxygenase [Pantoea sp. MQR6]